MCSLGTQAGSAELVGVVARGAARTGKQRHFLKRFGRALDVKISRCFSQALFLVLLQLLRGQQLLKMDGRASQFT